MYEDITGDPNYTQEIFRLVHQRDPGPKLFLNDYNVVSSGASTAVGILVFEKHVLQYDHLKTLLSHLHTEF